jgi:hypothetical protein
MLTAAICTVDPMPSAHAPADTPVDVAPSDVGDGHDDDGDDDGSNDGRDDEPRSPELVPARRAALQRHVALAIPYPRYDLFRAGQPPPHPQLRPPASRSI